MLKNVSRTLTLALAATPVFVGISAATAEAAVPSCVTTITWTDGIYKNAKATNNCTTAQRFYMAWNLTEDGDCVSKAPRQWHQEWVLRARFEGLKSC